MNEKSISMDDFKRVEMRIGTVLSVEANHLARKPAYVLEIDFGLFGVRTTSAQITELYKPGDLIGEQVVAVMNFPPKNIAGVRSEVLVLAAIPQMGTAVLLKPTQRMENGARVR
jgi:tRNA-binding protein